MVLRAHTVDDHRIRRHCGFRGCHVACWGECPLYASRKTFAPSPVRPSRATGIPRLSYPSFLLSRVFLLLPRDAWILDSRVRSRAAIVCRWSGVCLFVVPPGALLVAMDGLGPGVCAELVRLSLTFYTDALTRTHVNCMRVQSQIPTLLAWLHRSSTVGFALAARSLEGSTSRLAGDNDWLPSVVDRTAGFWTRCKLRNGLCAWDDAVQLSRYEGASEAELASKQEGSDFGK